MRQRFAIFSLLIAWLLATGSQWDLVQTFAWGRMFLGYAKTMSLLDAAKETFDPEKPCALCCAVRKAKQQQNNSSLPPETKLREKLLLVFQPSPSVVFLSLETNSWSLSDLLPLSAERAAPPNPPPRGMLA